MENKKISFGFSKVSKKVDKVVKEDRSVQLIECLEGQNIKVKDAVEEIKGPLVIPIKDTAKNLLDRVRAARERTVKTEVKQEIDSRLDSELTVDELAARELIREAERRENASASGQTKVYELPLKTEEKFVAEGEVEPTLDDYENVPISDYGMAMLRGMGWKEGMAIGKNPTKITETVVPELRPKGLGLGANKLVKAGQTAQKVDKDGKELLLIKGAFAKIIAGNHKNKYCQVEGLDDENCRIIVKTALTNEILTLNEFLLVPVTQEEFNHSSRVINNAKYEEFKARDSKNGIKQEELSDQEEPRTTKSSDSSSEDDRRKRRHDSRHKKKSKKHRHRSRSRDSDHYSRHTSKRRSRDRDYKHSRKNRK